MKKEKKYLIGFAVFTTLASIIMGFLFNADITGIIVVTSIGVPIVSLLAYHVFKPKPKKTGEKLE